MLYLSIGRINLPPFIMKRHLNMRWNLLFDLDNNYQRNHHCIHHPCEDEQRLFSIADVALASHRTSWGKGTQIVWLSVSSEFLCWPNYWYSCFYVFCWFSTLCLSLTKIAVNLSHGSIETMPIDTKPMAKTAMSSCYGRMLPTFGNYVLLLPNGIIMQS